MSAFSLQKMPCKHLHGRRKCHFLPPPSVAETFESLTHSYVNWTGATPPGHWPLVHARSNPPISHGNRISSTNRNPRPHFGQNIHQLFKNHCTNTRSRIHFRNPQFEGRKLADRNRATLTFLQWGSTGLALQRAGFSSAAKIISGRDLFGKESIRGRP